MALARFAFARGAMIAAQRLGLRRRAGIRQTDHRTRQNGRGNQNFGKHRITPCERFRGFVTRAPSYVWMRALRRFFV